MAPNDTIQPYIDRARRTHGRLTPYRLGLVVGEAGADVPCPYEPGSRGAKSYAFGLEVGRSHRAMDQAFNEPHKGPVGE